MDETKMRGFRWIADHASHYYWGLWGLIAGLFFDRVIGQAEIFGAVVAIFTVVLAFSTIGLWRVTGEVARATAQSVDQARRTSEANLRAFVTISKHRVLDYKLELGNVVIPCVTIRNVGRTQANNVRVAIMAAYVSPDEAQTIQLTDEPGNAFTLAPKEKSIFTGHLPALDADLITAITDGSKAIVLLATVTYIDIFGVERRTRMRAGSGNVKKVAMDGSIQLEWFGEDNDLT